MFFKVALAYTNQISFISGNIWTHHYNPTATYGKHTEHTNYCILVVDSLKTSRSVELTQAERYAIANYFLVTGESHVLTVQDHSSHTSAT